MRKTVFFLVNVLLTGFTVYSQPANDACGNAIELCPNTLTTGSNIGATSTVCPDCEDDLPFCFVGTNSVWYTFTTNSVGGNVTVDISNLVFGSGAIYGTELQAAMFQAAAPCAANAFTLVSNCVNNSSTSFQLNAPGLQPNTEYIFVITGAINGSASQPARATFDLLVSGPGADRLPAGFSIGQPAGEVCPNVPVGFSAYFQNCTDTSDISWYVNGVLTAITQNQYWWTSELQDGDVVSASCTCFTVCPVDLSFTCNPVSVNNLTVDAGLDQTVGSGDQVTLTGSTNGLYYQWSPATEVISPNDQVTFAYPENTTTFYFTASNDNCSLTDDVTIFIDDNLTIPGSFSPNGDGKNDTWYMPGIEYYPNAQLIIYSRWGQVIADITGYSHDRAWDGTHNGKPVPDGVYFYELNLHNGSKDEKIKGNITVIR